jgi:hypothetical protein
MGLLQIKAAQAAQQRWQTPSLEQMWRYMGDWLGCSGNK